MNFESILYKEIKITNKTSPIFILNDKNIDIWDKKYNYYHSKTPLDYISKRIIDSQKTKLDIFSQIICYIYCVLELVLLLEVEKMFLKLLLISYFNYFFILKYEDSNY